MKRLSLLTTIGIVLLVACNPHSKPAETATISGQVIPKTEDYLSFSAGTVLDSTKINADGHFETVIPVTGPVYGMLIYHNRMTQIYLQPGGHLVVHIQSRSFPDNTAFEGNLGPANHYLMLAGKLDRQVQIADKQLFSMPPDRFIAYSDSVRNLKSQLLKEYVKQYPEIDSSFVRAHQTDILYNWATQRILYPENYLILKGRTAKLPDSYHRNYLKQLDINQPANLASAAFQTFLNHFLDFQEALYLRDNPDVRKLWFPNSVARFRIIHRELTDSLIQNWALYQALNTHLDSYGTLHGETFITDFELHCHNQEYQDAIHAKLDKLKKLTKGRPAPDFSLQTIDGKTVNLKTYLGRLLYINFWSSWSDWSLREFAYWETLRKEFEPRGVTFLSVSMDFAKDQNKWAYIVKQKKLGGIQCIQDQKSHVLQDIYLINHLPRFFLIDRDGNIISTHAPGPDEPVIKATLTRLLRQ